MAGLGPTYAISISSENTASIIEGPALKRVAFILTSGPKYFSKVPLFSPITACAWLIFGKYPTRIVALLPFREQALPVTIAKNRRHKTTRYRKIFNLIPLRKGGNRGLCFLLKFFYPDFNCLYYCMYIFFDIPFIRVIYNPLYPPFLRGIFTPT